MRTISYAALISTALFAAGSSSRADTITMFNVSGTAVNQAFVPVSPTCGARATCPFSGTLDVDVTNGTVPGIEGRGLVWHLWRAFSILHCPPFELEAG